MRESTHEREHARVCVCTKQQYVDEVNHLESESRQLLNIILSEPCRECYLRIKEFSREAEKML